MKNKVIKRLQEQLDEVINKGYNEERILGIFLYGSQNYGFATENSDIDSRVIIIPSFEDFCLKKEWVSKTINMENGEKVDIKDIRLFRENLLKQNINFMEYCLNKLKNQDLLLDLAHDSTNLNIRKSALKITRYWQNATQKPSGSERKKSQKYPLCKH